MSLFYEALEASKELEQKRCKIMESSSTERRRLLKQELLSGSRVRIEDVLQTAFYIKEGSPCEVHSVALTWLATSMADHAVARVGGLCTIDREKRPFSVILKVLGGGEVPLAGVYPWREAAFYSARAFRKTLDPNPNPNINNTLPLS